MEFDHTNYNYQSRRTVIQGKNGMVATSQPLAAQAGLEILKKGGNAVDAAVATAACLTVVEPTSNGIGGDAFAIISFEGELIGLNASGASPELLTYEALEEMGCDKIPKFGLTPVTVPGVPKAWAELIKKYGNLSLMEVLEPAIKYAEEGYPISATVSQLWNKGYERFKKETEGKIFENWYKVFMPDGYPVKPGQIWKSKVHAETLKEIAQTGSDSFYKGNLGAKIHKLSVENNGFIRKSDLEKFEVEWVKPISVNYRGYDVWEIPPNGHGLVALIALNILKNFEFTDRESADTYHKQIEAIKLAFADGKKYITDPRFMEMSVESLLSEEYGKERAKLIQDHAMLPEPGQPDKGGTVYLATADKDGNMVSYIQSNYMGFGSGIVVPGTGISLHNRGNNFNMIKGHANCVAPNKKPYHTIIPGFLTKDGEAIGPFGVMGGFMQPQGHVQVVSSMIDFNLNPQDALNAPRWQWMEDKKVEIEIGVGKMIAEKLANSGHDINMKISELTFGRGQIIVRDEQGVYTGATEPRTDGHVAAW